MKLWLARSTPLAICAGVCAVVLTGCGGSGSDTVAPPPPPPTNSALSQALAAAAAHELHKDSPLK